MSISNHLIFLYLILLVIVYFYTGQNVFWADSEMWTVLTSFHLFGDYGHDHSIKPVFDYILYLVTQAGHFFSLKLMDSARLFFCLITAVNGLLFVRWMKRLNKNNFVIALTLMLCVSTSLFWERSFRVRSDYLVLALHLLALNILVSTYKTQLKYICCLALFVWAYFVSPKSVFVSFFICVSYIQRDSFKFLLKGNIAKIVGLLSLAAFGCLVFTFGGPAYSYFIESFTGSNRGIAYLDWQRYEHLMRAFSKNIWLLPLMVMSVCTCLRSWKKDRTYIFCLLTIIYLVVYPNKLPFFILSLLLFVIFPGVEFVVQLIAGFKRKLILQNIILIFLCLFSFYKAWQVTMTHNNFLQRLTQIEVCFQLESFPLARVYDPIGLCPERTNSHFNFLGPYHNNKNELEMIKILRPHILLNVAKLQFVLRLDPDYFRKNYSYNQSGFFYIKEKLNNQKAKWNKDRINYHMKTKYFREQNEFTVNYHYLTINNKVKSLESQILPENASFIELIPYDLKSIKLDSDLNKLFRFDAEI